MNIWLHQLRSCAQLQEAAAAMVEESGNTCSELTRCLDMQLLMLFGDFDWFSYFRNNSVVQISIEGSTST